MSELSDKTKELLRAARPGPEVPQGERDALLRSLAHFVGPVNGDPGGGGPEGPADPLAPDPAASAVSLARAAVHAKLVFGIGGLLAGVVLGAAGHSLMMDAQGPSPVSPGQASPSAEIPPPAQSSPVEAPPTPVESLPAVTPTAPRDTSARSAVVASGAASSRNKPTGSSNPEARDEALRKERRLLDIARTAIARGDGEAALDAVGRHASEFPHGRLREEREALRVQALVLAGRKEEARQRANEFREEHPNSLMQPGIDPALEEAR